MHDGSELKELKDEFNLLLHTFSRFYEQLVWEKEKVFSLGGV